jgi:hypothetical protein
MKRVALVIATLVLSAGAAIAATPGNSSAMKQPMMPAQTQSSDWRANQETKALNLLEAQGFSNFTGFRPAGQDQYAANVVQHGRSMTVHVNPQDGQITRG